MNVHAQRNIRGLAATTFFLIGLAIAGWPHKAAAHTGGGEEHLATLLHPLGQARVDAFQRVAKNPGNMASCVRVQSGVLDLAFITLKKCSAC